MSTHIAATTPTNRKRGRDAAPAAASDTNGVVDSLERATQTRRLQAFCDDAVVTTTTPKHVAPCQTLPLVLENMILAFAQTTKDALAWMYALGYKHTHARWDHFIWNTKWVDLLDFQRKKRRGILRNVFVTERTAFPAGHVPVHTLPNSVEYCSVGFQSLSFRLAFAPHSRLKHLTLNHEFDVRDLQLPPGIEYFHAGDSFNADDDFHMPDSMHHFITGLAWTHPLHLGLASQLQQLDLSGSPFFNEPCLHLPPTLTSIEFGDGFNAPISFASPETTHLKRLRFGQRHNQPGLAACIPAGTDYLVLGAEFNPRDFTVPAQVRMLYAGRDMSTLSFAAGCRLEYLTLTGNKLAELIVPTSVINVCLGPTFNAPVRFEPGSVLQRISMGMRFNQNICLPQTVTSVSHSQTFTSLLTFEGPPQLVDFFMGNAFNRADFTLPPATCEFYMGSKFDQNFQLPKSVVHFEMGDAFNSVLTLEADSALRSLVMGKQFDCTLPPLPPSIRFLEIGEAFSRKVCINNVSISMTAKRIVAAPNPYLSDSDGDDW